MTTLVAIGLVHAVLAGILAVVVFAVTRIWRNPHLAHVLWLLVLLKMVTPPLIGIPIPWGVNASRGAIPLAAVAELSMSEFDTVSAEKELSV